MTSILLLLLKLTVFLSGSEWFFNVGFRLYLAEIFALFFSTLFLLSRTKTKPSPENQLSTIDWLVRLYWITFSLTALSLINVLISQASATILPLYLKGELQLLGHTIILCSIAKFMQNLPLDKSLSILRWYFAGCVFSSVYGIIQAGVLKQYGIDISILIWTYFATIPPDYMGLERYAYGPFYRIKGWSFDPNVLASYIVTALPLMLVLKLRNLGTIIAIILGLALILCQSNSGMIGAVVASIFITIKIPQLKSTILKLILGLSIPVIILISVFPNEVLLLAKAKLDPSGTRQEHSTLFLETLNIAIENPLGHGYNTFSAVYENKTGIEGYNAHSSWLTFFVETGIHGLILQLLIVIFYLRSAWQQRNIYSTVFIATYLGICAAGLFYNTLTILYAQIYPILMLSVILKTGNKTKDFSRH